MQVLLINFPSLGSMSAGENFKFIFREAKINDAILFFDECEAIFESREKGSHDVNMLLTEIERYYYMGLLIHYIMYLDIIWVILHCMNTPTSLHALQLVLDCPMCASV